MAEIKQRNSNFELLRLMLMFLIVFHHAITHGLGLDSFSSWSNTPLLINSGEMNMYLLLNNLCIYAVNAFIIISGYFGIRSSWKKAGSLLLIVLFYTICFTAVPYVIVGDFRSAAKSLLILSNTPYWFIVDYLLLMLFAPVLNTAYEKADDKVMKIFTVGIVIVAVYLGFFWGREIDRSGYNFFHFIVMYAIGRGISKGWLKISKTIAGVFFLIAVVLNTIFACLLYSTENFDLLWKTTFYSNPLLIISATALVIYFKDINLQSKHVNWLASSSVAIYLFQNTDLISKQFYAKVVEVYMSTGGGVQNTIAHTTNVFCCLHSCNPHR